MQVINHVEQISVGILCHDWPSWAYAFSHKGFVVKFICVINPLIFEDIKNTFCDTYVCMFSTSSDCALPLYPVDILCFNGKESIRLATPPSVGVIILFDWKF